MESVEEINKVEQLLLDCEAITTTLDIMYYKKRLNEVEKYESIAVADVKFKKCRDLLKNNLRKLKYILDVNYNLFLALNIHLAVMTKEMEKIEEVNEDDNNDPLTVKEEDIKSSDNEIEIDLTKCKIEKYKLPDCECLYCDDDEKPTKKPKPPTKKKQIIRGSSCTLSNSSSELSTEDELI